MVGDLVTHDCSTELAKSRFPEKGEVGGWISKLTFHDVVAVGDETQGNGGRKNSQLPEGHRRLGSSGIAGAPGRVDDSPGTDRVSDIISAVSKRRRAGGKDLHEGVGVFGLVGVLLGVVVDSLHPVTVRGAFNAGLGGVDVVMRAIEQADDDHGRNAACEDLDIVELVDVAWSHGVVVQSTHGPAQGTALLPELDMKPFPALSHALLVGSLSRLGRHSPLLVIDEGGVLDGVILG